MKITGYNSVKSWGIVAACSLICSFIQIPIRAAALFFVAFLDRYDTNRQNASLFVIVSGILRFFAGPLTGYLAEIIEIRTLTIIGCFLSAFGVGICYLAEDITAVTVCIGVIFGTGAILSSFLIPQTIKQHFENNFAKANGAFSAGTNIATFLIIPVVSTLFSTYGVSGALLLTCGIMLHAVPVAMLLRDPKYKKTSPPCAEKELTDEGNLRKNPNDSENSNTDSANLAKQLTNIPIVNNIEVDNYMVKSDIKSSVYVSEESQTNCAANHNTNGSERSKDNNSQINTNIKYQPPMNVKMDKSKTYLSFSVRENSIYGQSETVKNKNKYLQALKILTILKDPIFVVIMFCLSAQSYIDVFVATIMVDISRDKGIPQNLEQFLVMFFVIMKTVGYICLGWVADKGYIKVANYTAIGFVCMGLSCCSFAFSNNFLTMMLATVGFGLFAAAVACAGPNLVYEFVEEKMQTMAITSRLSLSAPLNFTIAPLIGYFRGTLGSYDGVLYFLTAVSMGCAVLLLLLPQLKRCTQSESKSSMDSKKRQF